MNDDTGNRNLHAHADNSKCLIGQTHAFLGGAPTMRISEDHVQSLLNARRGREALFGKPLFSDPAWDIILELYAAALGDRLTSRLDLARSLALPETVISRWIAVLAAAGIVRSGETDHQIVDLTQQGAAKIASLVNHWGSAFLAI